MTPDRIRELRELLTVAEGIPLPWAEDGLAAVVCCKGLIAECQDVNCVSDREHSAALIVAAVNALPEILDELERLRAAVKSSLAEFLNVDASVNDRVDVAATLCKEAGIDWPPWDDSKDEDE